MQMFLHIYMHVLYVCVCECVCKCVCVCKYIQLYEGTPYWGVSSVGNTGHS